jgi:transposase
MTIKNASGTTRKLKHKPAPFKPAAYKPTAYKPAYCRRVIWFMGRGYSLTALAAHIGVSRDTVDGWTQSHPEFAEAVQRAQAARVFFWEKRLLTADRARITPVLFALRHACPSEWQTEPSPSTPAER